MAKYLFIIESPGKQKKIQSFLGKDFKVIGTAGHIRDLPSKGLNVDIKNNFEPTYAVYDDKKDIVKKIKDEASKAEIVYIGTDIDREGEAIAQGVVSILPANTVYKRAKYNSITKDEILKSIEEASCLNLNMVDSAECRRIVDRLAGYKISFPTQQATGGKSAGRVQSAGLRILADREKEIQSFVPQEYWPIEVDLKRKNGEVITVQIKNPDKLKIKNEKHAYDIIDALKKEKWSVSKYETKDRSTKAYPPFTTSSLYQSASSILGWDSNKTASVAQSLYENGSISYIRTDSTYIVPEFISSMRELIGSKYGDNYISSNVNVFSNRKNAQEAHEAIRITHSEVELVDTGDNRRLYEIIWKRSMASQAANMIQLTGSADFSCDKYIFGLTGSKITFDGWSKIWNYGTYADTELPEFKVGEKLDFVEARTEQKFTSPPPRYSEASFIKELEKKGIGRPSTYKTIIDVLKKREYVDVQKKMFHVTDMGIRVSDFLVESNVCFSDLDFTSKLEDDLDKIVNCEETKLSVLTNFWNRLKSDLDNVKIIKTEKSKTDYPCPKCEGFLELKHSKFGPFYSCANRTDKEIKCDYKCQVGENGEPVEIEKKEVEKSDFECPSCGEKLVKRISKKGWEYLACTNWKDDACKGFFDKESGEKIEFKKKKFNKRKKKS